MPLLQFEVAGTMISLTEDEAALVIYGSQKHRGQEIEIFYNPRPTPQSEIDAFVDSNFNVDRLSYISDRIMEMRNRNNRKQIVHVIERNVNGIPIYAAIIPRIDLMGKNTVDIQILNSDIKIGKNNVVTVFKGNISEVIITE